MQPIAYLFCIKPDLGQTSGSVLLQEVEGGQITQVNINILGADDEALVEVYRQLVVVANDTTAPWKEQAP